MTEELADHPAVRSDLPFGIVGIGASAGGMNALASFFENVPADAGMAFVVVLHLSPDYQSHASSILQRSTALIVREVTDAVRIEANHVYVIPPGKQLTMDDGHLRLAERAPRKGRHVDIDLFFRTLAETHGANAFGVVVSGAGADGAVGLKSIKECGGITLAQAPDEAEHDSMPVAAIAAGVVDFVMPVAAMPRHIVGLWKNAQQIRLPAIPFEADDRIQGASERDEAALSEILAILRRRTRHDFRQYKRGTTLRRVERRLQVNALYDLSTYRDYLRDHEEETLPLLQDLLISVTNFFRDAEAFEALEGVLGRAVERRGPADPLRVWVPGCATGEEAYSIAILLREQCDRLTRGNPIQIFATDIDDRAIAIARAGVYSAAIAADVSSLRLRRFFHGDQDRYQVNKSIRDSVLFATHNVLSDPPFSRLDLVCCRNLLIYLTRSAQGAVLDTFRYALRPEGLLFLGLSESPDAADDSFSSVDKKRRIFESAGPGQAPRGQSIGTPPDAKPGASTLRGERRVVTMEDLHRQAIERFSAPSVLLDGRHRILHLSAGAGQYLLRGDGKPSNDLIANVQPDLRLELRAALFKAEQNKCAVTARDIPYGVADTRRGVDITVQVFESEQHGPTFLVTFEEHALDADAVRLDASTEPLVSRLEAELADMKAHLQETIDRSNVGNEDLRASNGELQAMVEELRSTGEELETSKEELQSINEELTTVNDELSKKVDETAKINDDLQNLIASTDIAVVFVDAAMRVMRFTPRARELFNLIPGDIGRPLNDVRHQFVADQSAEDAEEAFRTLRPVEREVRGLDGRYYLSRVLPYRTVEDRIDGAVLTFVDVSRRRIAEEEALRSATRLRRAAESTRDYAIITMDDDGIIQNWNAGAEKTFGYEESEAVGHHVAMIFTPEDRAAGAPQRELEDARAHGRAEDERWHRRKDGERFYCSGVMTRLEGPGSGFAKIARDMTGSKLLETHRELRLSRETETRVAAEEANRLKDEFLAVMSHELKHPLNLIHINAELLTRTPEIRDLPLVVRAAETIRQTVSNQAQIIDDLLDLSRARIGKMTLKLDALSLSEVARRIVDASSGDAEAKGVRLTLDAGDPTLRIRGDAVRVEQIVWNLVSNAIKFTPAGGSVRAAIVPDGPELRLDVADSGRGIATGFLAHIFEMFQQEMRTFGAHPGGMGIGLALVKELAVAQGGRVSAQSEGLDRGATFSVWLPFDRPGTVTPGPKPEASAHPLAGLRVLLVDDSPDVLAVMAELMRLEGSEVTDCGSGAAALAAFGHGPFDLLISDVGMPDMDGYQLIDEIRKLPGGHRVPAIALTGLGRATDARRAMETGFDAYLGKPTAMTDIVAAVHALLARPRADERA